MDTKNEGKKYKISRWLLVVVYSFMLCLVFSEILFGDYLLSTIVGLLIAFYCAEKNATWAFKIDKNVNVAFGIGFFIGLFGLIGYWIYYKYNKRQIKNREKKQIKWKE